MGAIETKVDMHSPKGNSHVMVEELHEESLEAGKPLHWRLCYPHSL